MEYGAVVGEFSYYLCESCDALSIHPLPRDRLSEIYPQTYYSFAAAGAPTERRSPIAAAKAALDRRQFARVRKLVPSERPSLLDVGGGSGSISAGLVRASRGEARATVVDIDEASIAVARSRGLDGAVSRFEDFETDERYDVVLMLNLLEHVSNPVEILVKARDLLAPGGLLWLQTPNFRSLDARLFRNRSWTGLHCPRHWVVFSAAGLRSVLERAGLEVHDLEYTQAGSFWAGSLLGWRRSRKPVTLGARPLVQSRLFLPLAGLGAGIDLTTRWARPTSQVVAFARTGAR